MWLYLCDRPEGHPGVAFKIFSKLSQRNINVDIILQSVGRDGTKDITFTVSKDNGPLAVEILNDEVGGFRMLCATPRWPRFPL